MKYGLLSMLLVGIFCGANCAQDGQPTPRFNLSFQLVRTDGSKIYLEQAYLDRTAEKVEQTYTVMRPVTETFEVDGKQVTRTKMVRETRTRMNYPTKRRSIPVAKNYKFTDLEGKEIQKVDLIGRLGMGSGRYVLYTFAGQKIAPEAIEMLDKKTIVMQVMGPVTPNAVPAPAPARAEFRVRPARVVPDKID